MKDLVEIILKSVLLALFAPLVTGYIAKLKNVFRMRKGPGVLQPYYNLIKLFQKDEVVSKHASWIFLVTPIVVFAGTVCAMVLVLSASLFDSASEVVVVLLASFFVMGSVRFFSALAGLDAGSAFGGMGSSREVFISGLAEPSLFISVFALCISGSPVFKLSVLLGGISVFLVALAETSRIPIDNRETHLELTMVHEAMVLEYSGRSLAVIEFAGHIKQMLFFVLILWFFALPLKRCAWGWALFPAEIAVLGLLIAVIELSFAKMRLFRVVDFMGFAFFIALAASVAACLGL
ncbi:MAG: NADH-quinone oxidoreductase subunit H [Candidatus Omnitrophica bacterium]|nr:NADH-quinone oxidoreductase subunit H [Candidatus Omnitrophota bacterium]